MSFQRTMPLLLTLLLTCLVPNLPKAGFLTDLQGPGEAQAGTAPSYNLAPIPYNGGERWYCVQSNVDKSCRVQDIWNSPVIGSFSITPIGAPGSVDLRKITNDTTVIRAWGYIGDGGSHPLSGITNFGGTNTTGFTLPQWQALLPSATALSNEVDGEAVRSYIMAATGPLTVYLPAGTGKFSNPIASCANSVTLFGAGASETILSFVNGTDGWDHCPVTGTLTKIEAHNLQFNSTTLSGTLYAVKALFSPPSKNVYFDNVYLFNFNFGMDLTNAAGIQLNYVWIVNGNASGTAANGDGIAIHGTNTFVERMSNVLVQNYTTSYNFISTNSSGQGIEDVAVINSACGGTKVCISITAPNFAGYGPYKYSFTDMSVDATTQFINAPQERSLIVRGGDWIVDPPVGTWTGATADFITINKGSVARFEDMSITNNTGVVTINSYMHVIGTNTPSDIQITGNSFEYLNLTATAAQIVVDAAATGVIVKDNQFTSNSLTTAPPANAFSFAASDTQSNLSVGRIGQIITCNGTGVVLANTVAGNLATCNLPKGDWDCQGYAQYLAAGEGANQAPTFMAISTSLTSATLGGTYDNLAPPATPINQVWSLIAHTTDYGPTAVSTPVYLVGQANFPAGSVTGNNAIMNCRRWR